MTQETKAAKPSKKAAKEPATAPTAHPSLQMALLAAQRKVQAVIKNSYNDFANFAYASAENMIQYSRGVLLEEGVVVTRGEVTAEPNEAHTHAIVHGVYHLDHPESNTSRQDKRDFPAITQKGKPLDKGFASALTTDLSYYLRDLLLIPRADKEDKDIHGRDDNDFDPSSGGQSSAPTSAASSQAAGGVDPNETVNEEEFAALQKLLAAANADMPKFLKRFGVPGLGVFKRKDVQLATDMLNAKIRNAKKVSDAPGS